MGRVKIFTTRRCPKCPQAHKVGELLKERGVKVEFFDLETPDGLAEAAGASAVWIVGRSWRSRVDDRRRWGLRRTPK